jgi:two-component system sensor histidine kinase HydH
VGGIQGYTDDHPPERLELPIFSHQKMVGLLSLESKQSGEVYTLSDLGALESFSSQAGLAIENIQLLNSVFETNQRLFEAEKLVSLGQLASGVAHEIRNPLSSIKLNIQGLARSLKPEPINSKRLEIIQREIDHLDHIVHDVLIYARPTGLKIESVDLRDLLVGTLDLLGPALNESNHKIILRLPETLAKVAADRDKLHQVCKNLIVNASDAMSKGGYLEISAQEIPAQVELIFSDNGPGMTTDIINSIFNPFFTTKADGTGLGLANAQKFIQEMGGEITVTSEAGEGAEFTVTLPIFHENTME